MLILGDCFERLRELDDASIDAVVTDPPYGISFMGKHWDRFDIERRVGNRDVSKLGTRLSGDLDGGTRKPTARTASAFANAAGEAGDYDVSLTGNRRFQEWCAELGCELLRVLKPGGHALVFGGTRTHHRMTAGLEDAGFVIRDELQWLFGSGFPKSLNLDGEYDGWGTALKPGHEPIVLARKPLVGTVAANVAAHVVGALNIDACRIEHVTVNGGNLADNPHLRDAIRNTGSTFGANGDLQQHQGGRWPANVVLDDEAAAILDEQTGALVSGQGNVSRESGADRAGNRSAAFGAESRPAGSLMVSYGDRGGASRFFYCAKVSRSERNAGLDGFSETSELVTVTPTSTLHRGRTGGERVDDREYVPTPRRNHHPTVKPLDLMRWLTRLVTPPGGTVLDPFLGSGSTGCAAALEGFEFVGIERESDYMAIAEARIAFWREHGDDGLRIVRERDAAEAQREEIRAAGQLDLLAEDVA